MQETASVRSCCLYTLYQHLGKLIYIIFSAQKILVINFQVQD